MVAALFIPVVALGQVLDSTSTGVHYNRSLP
jgi:hypothetical protein